MVSTIILVNPNAGRGRASALARELVSRQKTLSDALWLEPADATQARTQLDQALSDDCQRLIVVGGDGTLNLAVNAVLDKGLGKKVYLSVLPAGTGVDFARTLDPYPTLETLSVVLNRKRSRPVDVLQVNWQNDQHRVGWHCRYGQCNPGRRPWPWVWRLLAGYCPCVFQLPTSTFHVNPGWGALVPGGSDFARYNQW